MDFAPSAQRHAILEVIRVVDQDTEYRGVVELPMSYTLAGHSAGWTAERILCLAPATIARKANEPTCRSEWARAVTRTL